MSHVSEQQRSPKKRPVHLRAIVRDPLSRTEPLSFFGLPLQQGQKVQGNHSTLAGRQVAAVEVGGDDPLDRGAATRPFGETRRYTGKLASGKAVAAIENLAVEDHDGAEQPTEFDVVGKLTKFGIGQKRKSETGGMELVGFWR